MGSAEEALLQIKPITTNKKELINKMENVKENRKRFLEWWNRMYPISITDENLKDLDEDLDNEAE
jgi:hypothetical protein